jgi:hypothetical protein
MGIDTAAASIPGDFNNDGTVGAADYVVWRKGRLGSTYTPADYTAWRTNFGRSTARSAAVGIGAALPTVPEPSALSLGFLSTCCALASARRRSQCSPEVS